ncbi:alpha-galactosidase [Puia sp.]|jgi:alpha-galactosidase|uniref:alpha-galactosidase n=1 Tax=Puia sp. TaxID=2045100 RepID=UPI002F3F42E4
MYNLSTVVRHAVIAAAVFCGLSTPVSAQLTIPITTAHNALVLHADATGRLNTLYFGEKLTDTSDYSRLAISRRDGADILSSAYTPAGSTSLAEPAIAVTHTDGNKSLDLRYVSHTTTSENANVSTTAILLKDPVYALEVTLYYKVYANDDVIEQWSRIDNKEKGPVTLDKYASANLCLKADRYWLRQYHGDWAKEMQPEESQLTHGIKTIDTKLGARADLFEPSVFMVSLDKPAGEDEGSVLYGSVEWSGNFRVDLEVDPNDDLRIIAGINNYASPYVLKPGQQLTTPAFLYTFSARGKGEASRNLHRWARDYKIPNGRGDRLTLLNNWESTYFNFNEDTLRGLIKDAKKLGVNLFLLDDGWFGNDYPRNDDHAGLGDWQENRKKLPNGLIALVKEAQQDGVKFGIWVEPEMVNPKSDLYFRHPDWVVKQPGREEHYYRNQLVLDLANPAVQDFVYGIVDSLFIKNPGLAYIKWDCNAVIYNAYSAYLKKDQSQFYVDYVRGLYHVLDRLRAKYPAIPMMLCSGGGGRVDYGALKYFTEYWPSDNTDPLERIFIQWEYSYFYPAIASANHVTNWGKQPLKFKIDVAMMGKLGFDIPVAKLSPADLAFCQNALKLYGEIRSVIWQGDQYRLSDPHIADMASMLFVDSARSSAVLFNYLANNRYGAGNKAPIRLKGLDPAKHYRVQEVDRYPGSRSGRENNGVYSGDFLMKIGLDPQINSSRTSVVIRLTAE